MKKCLWVAIILTLALSVALCGCDNMSPWGEKTAQNNETEHRTYTVYVYGAVKNEGYYRVNEGDTYYHAIVQAGLITQSRLSPNYNTIVTDEHLAIVVQYTENGSTYDCINVNSMAFLLVSHMPNMSDSVVAKIAEYLQNNGKIHNKTELRAILGEDYEYNYYKLYIAEADYEEIG